jgi:hypothetical protein
MGGTTFSPNKKVKDSNNKTHILTEATEADMMHYCLITAIDMHNTPKAHNPIEGMNMTTDILNF